MTNVTSHIETVSRYIWTVPCNWGDGRNMTAVVGDLVFAWEAAAQAAHDLGINVNCDDWAKVSPQEESIIIYFDRSAIVSTDSVR